MIHVSDEPVVIETEIKLNDRFVELLRSSRWLRLLTFTNIQLLTELKTDPVGGRIFVDDQQTRESSSVGVVPSIHVDKQFI